MLDGGVRPHGTRAVSWVPISAQVGRVTVRKSRAAGLVVLEESSWFTPTLLPLVGSPSD